MCTLPQGATNSIAHMVNAMNKVLRDCIPEITMPFLDDIPNKGSLEKEKDGSKDEAGCRRFVVNHIKYCEKVLQMVEYTNLTLSGENSAFGQPEVLVVGHVWSIWPQIVSNQSGCSPREEGRMYIIDRSVKILGSVCLLSYLDSALRSCRRAIIWITEEKEEVRMARGAYK